MAVTSLWAIKSNLNRTIDYASDKNKTLKDLDQAVDYACNKDKTEESYYITAINCNIETAKEEMKDTKKYFNKKDKILGYHGYQSFKENEVTSEIAHEIGVKLANEMWGDKYQVIVTTHLNTNHIHNHFIVNSVSFVDGSKYNTCRANTAQLRFLNDSICKEYNISYLEEKETSKSNINFSFYLKSDKENKINYYEKTKNDIDFVIKKSNSYNEFIDNLKSINYEVYERYGKLSVRNLNYKRNIRIERVFGDEYSIENIHNRIKEEVLDNKIEEYDYVMSRNKKPKIKYHGLIGLYRYYCFLLKIYPNKTNYYDNDMKYECEKLNYYNNIIKFLDEYKIDSYEDLRNIETKLKVNYDELHSSKRKLRYQYSKINNPNEKERIISKIREINLQMDKMGKELNLCSDLFIYTPNIENKINEIEKENNREKIKE